MFKAFLLLSATALAAGPQLLGRVDLQGNEYRMTWPGTGIQGKFQGTDLQFKVLDSINYFRVEIDGQVQNAITPAPGERLFHFELKPGIHQFQIFKQTESRLAPALIKDISILGGTWMELPAKKLKFEFYGDSYTAAMGNENPSRECSWEQSMAKTRLDLGFAVLLARHFNADFEINAASGMGIERNWNGNYPEINFRMLAPRLLENSEIPAPMDSSADLLVIGLGTNDFSTPPQAHETWTKASLREAFVQDYTEMVWNLHQNKSKAQIILSSHDVWPDHALIPAVREIQARLAQKGLQVAVVEFDSLEVGGCYWHPSLHDHQRMADALIRKVNELKIQ